MGRGVVTAGFLAAVVFSAGFAFPQSRPKDHYKNGEQFLKQGRLYDAVREFNEAARLEPRNKKFQKKAVEVRKDGSARAETEAQQYLAPSKELNPARARDLLERALEYDGTNALAAQELELLRRNIATAAQRVQEAQALLDRGEIGTAESLLNSVLAYREVIVAIPELEKELTAGHRARAAQSLWEKKEMTRGLGELVAAEREAPNSTFIKTLAKKLRREMSDDLVAQAVAISPNPTRMLLEKLWLADMAVKVDKGNESAAQLRTHTSAAWADMVLRQARSPGSERRAARASLETLRLAESQVAQEASYVRTKAELESLAYPALRIRIVFGDFENCPPGTTRDGIQAAVREALAPIALVDEEPWDFTLGIKNLSCSSTDIQRQGVQRVNSTYVAGHNQLTNPEYVNLSSKLQYAQQQLNQAYLESKVNPGFGSGFALGMWQGTVARLQRTLSATPPYITQEIVQQYHYDKFEAYRSYQIEGTLRAYSKTKQQFASEKKVSFVAEDRKEGISGVLPEDRTVGRNVEPDLLPLEQCANQASEGFKKAVSSASKELVEGYFATVALNRGLKPLDRLASLLYAFDLADSTVYDPHKRELAIPLKTALLAELEETNSAQAFVDSLSLPVPEQAATASAEIEEVVPTSTLERSIQGVVAIETDAGKAGSGFFLTPACLVVTNEHVVGDAETIVLRTSAKKLFMGSVLAKDSDRDLALLRSNARTCTPLSLEDPAQAVVGQEIYAIGDPLGLSGTVTRGIISALRTASGIHYMQLDAAINPGNSGGPLVNRSGRVVGVTTFRLRGYEGLNFAIASSEIKNAFGRFLQ